MVGANHQFRGGPGRVRSQNQPPLDVAVVERDPQRGFVLMVPLKITGQDRLAVAPQLRPREPAQEQQCLAQDTTEVRCELLDVRRRNGRGSQLEPRV